MEIPWPDLTWLPASPSLLHHTVMHTPKRTRTQTTQQNEYPSQDQLKSQLQIGQEKCSGPCAPPETLPRAFWYRKAHSNDAMQDTDRLAGIYLKSDDAASYALAW